MDYQKRVQEVLDQAVEAGTECGCQAALYINGELAVNAYAGWTDWTKTQKVDENTIFPIFSTGKPMSSTVLHRLVESGKLSYDTRIADIWPEFGCNGKEDMRVWHVMSYRAGLYDVPEVTPEEYTNFDIITAKMAKQTPGPEYPMKQKYHPFTYGWLTAGIACHVLGRNDFFNIFKEYVGNPTGMNRFYFGAPANDPNAAILVSAKDGSNYDQQCLDMMNNPLYRCSCNPATCSMSNALSIARHYAAIDQGKLLSKATLTNAITPKWRDVNDPIPLVKGRWDLFGLGYVLSGPVNDVSQIFGHGGIGGSEALLDQKRHYAIAITRNVFASPNVLTQFYETVDFKNRDWPDPAEMPEQIKKQSAK